MSVDDALLRLAATVALDYDSLIRAAQRQDHAAVASMLAAHGPELVAAIRDARRQARLQSLPTSMLREVQVRDQEIERLSRRVSALTAQLESARVRLGTAQHNRRVDGMVRATQRRMARKFEGTIRKLRATLKATQAKVDAAQVELQLRRREIARVTGLKIQAHRAVLREDQATNKHARMRQLLFGGKR